MTPFLFVTDLDNTLVGDRASLQELNQLLEHHRQTHGTKIVYATGRSLYLYQQLASEANLLVPDALIAAVGTEIYLNRETSPHIDWANHLNLGWNRETVVNIAAEFADLLPQSHSEQGNFKVSYFLAAAAAVEVLPRLESLLESEKIEAKLIYSSGKDLDIIPRQSDKGLAVKFMQNYWQMTPDQTVVCGDSGNDIPLFSVGEERGIVVGNAQPELSLWCEVNPVSYRYQAKANYAGGILEGLMYFGFAN
ncbi:sucrose-phosphate phosphatase [Merismopedia glauca]|uniref:sucrose-phosphate phosphatase n=1 Tax=Merismopedia glauca CCAP 1448/3 TaxID=1296344 RepID=A0A2T1C202_9CYAN|nr:sucrose-phosphate phosphatase [Merismopedia glauca]PSB02315.1 sucrose-phosphate phosphatase [Merismopedia glauca CCAP 1448/3]